MFEKLFGKKKRKVEDPILEEEKVEGEMERKQAISEENMEQELSILPIEEEQEKKEEEALKIPSQKMEEELSFEEEKPKEKKGFFQKLKEGLEKTRDNFTKKIDDVFLKYKKVDEELFEELEEILITADLGYETVLKIMDSLRTKVKKENIQDVSEIKRALEKSMVELLKEHESEKDYFLGQQNPTVLLVVGVNGVGKTTTIGKMANLLQREGKKVIVAAADTFRAAAIEQLEEWAKRAKVDLIAQSEGSDPASVVYDAIHAAKARKADVLICDTAGRLHNKKNLMNELSKIKKIIEREYPEANKEVLLVLDATTGQNAVIQAKTFHEVSELTGLILTKLDGTAKGGVVFSIEETLDLPIRFICVGEKIDDLEHFDSESFVKAIFGEEE